MSRDTLKMLHDAKKNEEPEQVSYSGNSTAGRETGVHPTGFFFQTTKPESEPAMGSVWRHKNGNVYRVTAIANGNSERDEYPPTVVYTNVVNGTVWSRRVDDWARSMTRISDALAQPEPVAWRVWRNDIANWSYKSSPVNGLRCDPLYTAPPKKEWVGLTDYEYELMAEKRVTNYFFNTLDYAHDIEAMLKEKNT